ncbi:DUF805 domain-containing protein [Aeromonas sp. R6-2]|uniref:DUF805 domain-containing protein n=1 Tax=unclassified Aeromonas TaxID=257493 RepID=UPI0034A4E39D
MKWYLSVLKQYAVFRGRARRKEFWMFTLINLVVIAALFMVMAMVGSPEVAAMVTFICPLAVCLPALAVNVRRLHDVDRSGWWLLISLIPLVGPLVLLYFQVSAGTAGPNRFGDDPKATTLSLE